MSDQSGKVVIRSTAEWLDEEVSRNRAALSLYREQIMRLNLMKRMGLIEGYTVFQDAFFIQPAQPIKRLPLTIVKVGPENENDIRLGEDDETESGTV